MIVKQHLPSETLKPFIKTFLIIESDNGAENRVLPDTSIVLSFRYKGSINSLEHGKHSVFPSSVISGLRKSPRQLNYSNHTSNLLVIFKAGGASAFFNIPFNELFGETLPFDQLMAKSKISEIEERLAEADTNHKRISIIESFLIALLKTNKLDLLALEAVEKIKSTKGNIRIKELIKDLSISQDPFEKRFRRVIGTTPKLFTSIVRFRSIIERKTRSESLTSIAYEAGYFDQAHFIRDFQTFTGHSPHQFFKSPSFW